ncbi:unnamed protein product [Tetraodon nigroviridis]|uniref:(spotted green pufferfish) hypothetical protein n=1 Tax=Tetraodon nigroviridis TaxID=99883 RepID=Q4RM91_TETNG|nr:unnamed protein product [Tetraodon nigroviridis]
MVPEGPEKTHADRRAQERMPRSIVGLDDTPHHVTIHILLLCSMFHDNKVRRTAEVRLSSCFLGWKFQPLRAICLYVH